MKKLIFFFALILSLSQVFAQSEVTFKAMAPGSVAMGEQFKLVYSINAQARDLQTPDLSDFDVLFGPATTEFTSMNYTNGKATNEYSLSMTYTLMPKKEGTFTIGPATIKAKGANYSSNALTIKVLPPNQPSQKLEEGATKADIKDAINKNGIFARVELSKKKVYEQEAILATFKLYTLYDCEITNVKFPEYAGFLAQEIENPNPQWVLENVNGRNYSTVVLRQAILYPQKTGLINIEGAKINANIRVRVERKNAPRSVFDLDSFFDQYQEVQKEVVVAPQSVDVIPLPSGKPASFNGAVGEFSMTAKLKNSTVKTNESLVLDVNISGSGNIKLIKDPEVKFPNDFEIYDPKVESNINVGRGGASGSKKIEYLAIPRFAGDFEIPAIEFSYFDVKSKSYKTLTQGPFNVHVEKGANDGTSPQVINDFTRKEDLKHLGSDIRYIKVKGINFVQRGAELFGTFAYWLMYIIPTLLFAIFVIIYRKRIKENADIEKVRNKKANKIAVRRLKSAGKLLQEHKKEAFYDEVMRALWGYISDKLNIEQAVLTKENVQQELMKHDISANMIDDFISILNECEFARYAPGEGSEAMDKLYSQALDVIGRIENTFKK